MERHRILGDKVHLYRRADGGPWHCYTYLKGQEWRRSTKERSLARAKDVAEATNSSPGPRSQAGGRPSGT